MQFKLALSVFALAAASFVNADPITAAPRAETTPAEAILESEFLLTSVTTGKTLTSLASALVSAMSSMNADSKDISAFSVLHETAPSNVLASISKSGIEYIYTTAEPKWFSELPKDVRTILISRQSVINSIETHILDIKTTPTSNPAPKPTAEMVMGALAAGAVGIVAML